MALEGDLPLVFWDEFDAPLDGEPLGWLQHFLAPMEDGRFRDGASFHPPGRRDLRVRRRHRRRASRSSWSYGDERAERAAKKPDFVSRLRGYVDVTGPNRQDAADVAWPLRRALLLRSLIARRAPQMMRADADGPRLEIDDGVLRAFLLVGEYIHGARSMAGHRRDERAERQAALRALQPAGAPAAGAARRRRRFLGARARLTSPPRSRRGRREPLVNGCIVMRVVHARLVDAASASGVLTIRSLLCYTEDSLGRGVALVRRHRTGHPHGRSPDEGQERPSDRIFLRR